MDKKTFYIILIILMITLISACKKYEPVSLVFKNVNIIPMTEETVFENYSVYTSEGKIKAIGKFEELEYPRDTIIIDCQGKYLAPGFGDMHVHTHYIEEATLFLANGVTLIRNMWGNPQHLKMKKKIQNRQFLGPELFTTGPLIDGKGAIWPGSFIITDPKEVAGAITKMKQEGYDAIKVYDKLMPKVYDEILKTAKSLDIPVVGHVPVGVKHAIESGQYSIEHFKGYNMNSKASIDLTVQSGVWNCPTLIVMKNYSNVHLLKTKEIPELKYVHPDRLKSWKQRYSYYMNFEGSKRFLKALYDKGANIVSGTDVGNPYVIAGFSLHEEFQYMNDAGLTPYQVLLTTTINPAKMLGIENRVGTIEIGKDADLVLLAKNPLLDIKNTKMIAGVMTKGVWLSEKKLKSMLDKIAR
ncbi:MAG: amidohydrolase family protein [Spirochaetales bacterium]|nr:amidohydrolase family protein [Spirochaetales bacterium]